MTFGFRGISLHVDEFLLSVICAKDQIYVTNRWSLALWRRDGGKRA